MDGWMERGFLVMAECGGFGFRGFFARTFLIEFAATTTFIKNIGSLIAIADLSFPCEFFVYCFCLSMLRVAAVLWGIQAGMSGRLRETNALHSCQQPRSRTEESPADGLFGRDGFDSRTMSFPALSKKVDSNIL